MFETPRHNRQMQAQDIQINTQLAKSDQKINPSRVSDAHSQMQNAF